MKMLQRQGDEVPSGLVLPNQTVRLLEDRGSQRTFQGREQGVGSDTIFKPGPFGEPQTGVAA